MIEPFRGQLFRLLGPLEVRSGQSWSRVSAPKWRLLLAVLLLRHGQIVPTDRLVAEIWGDAQPRNAPNMVSVYVHHLRRLIGADGTRVLVTSPPGYQLVCGPQELDCEIFEALVGQGRSALAGGDPERAALLLTDADRLWRGQALADVPASSLVSAEAQRLDGARVEAQRLRAEADLACGRHGEVVADLQRLTAGQPLQEELWVLLMRALQGAGRQAEALAAYARARDVIAGELGVDPGPELQRLYQDILSADAARAGGGTVPVRARAAAGGGRPAPVPAAPAVTRPAVTRPAVTGPAVTGQVPADPAVAGPVPAGPAPAVPAPAGPVPAQLPADIADFTGRAGPVAQVRSLLGGERDSPGAVPVVVVAGGGGLGKTALAVRAAHLVTAEFPDGQLYVNLLGATEPREPGEVLARFLRDLGVEASRVPAGEEERAAAFRTLLAGRRVLIVLDDARDAGQVRPLLPGGAGCAVLITSRSRMPDLPGARFVDLEELAPEEARALFGRVAGEARAQAEPEATDVVLAACAGLPLAIRIAGARLAARGGWTVRTLSTRLTDEHRRLDELRAGNLAVRASFEVSFAHLSTLTTPGGVDPAHAFCLLGIWTGPSASLPAVAALLGEPELATADAMETLIDANLLQSPVPDRYRLHDLLRVYAAGRARTDEAPADRQAAISRILVWYLHTTEAAAAVISPQHTRVPLPPLPAGVTPGAFISLDQALAWSETERLNLAAATRLAVTAGLPAIAWQLPAAAMSFYYRRSHWADWIATHEAGLASARESGDRRGEAWMLNNLGMAHGIQRREEAVTCFQQALAIHRELGNGAGEAQAATNVATAWFQLRRFPEACAAAEQSLSTQRRVGNRYGEGIALGVLGAACRELGRFSEAASHAGHALAIFRELGDRMAEADSLSDLGEIYLQVGRVGDAISSLTEGLAIWRDIDDRHGQAATLRRLGHAYQRAGGHERAGELLSEAATLFEELGDQAQAAQTQAERGKLRLEAG